MDPRQLASLGAIEVRRLAVRMQRADAEDIVQEAMLRFCRLYQNQQVDSPERLLRRIIRHLVIDRYHAARSVSGRACVLLADDDLARIADSAPRADEVVMARQAFGAAMRVLMSLSEGERAVYLEHALDGRTVRELADEYSTPKSTVADQVSAVRNTLRAVALKHGYNAGAQ